LALPPWKKGANSDKWCCMDISIDNELDATGLVPRAAYAG